MNNQKIFETSLLTLFTGCALLAFSSPGLAKDLKTFHGSECKPVAAQDAANFKYSAQGGITNIGLTTKNVICPLVRDSEKAYSPLSTATLYVQGSAFQVYFACTAAIGNFTVTKNAVFQDLAWTIDFNGAPFNSNDAGSGPITLTCALPKGASLTLYTLTEMNTGT